METITRDELKELEGRTLRIVTMNGGLLRNRDSAFFAALNDEEAQAFCETVRSELPEGEYEFSTVGFEVPDISYFSLLFDNGTESVDQNDRNSHFNQIRKYKREHACGESSQ